MPPQDPQDPNSCQQDDPNDPNGTSQQEDDGATDPATPTPEACQAATDSDESGSETDNTPTPAPVTNDSHRVTIYVPHEEETVLNLGMGAPTGEETIADNGITGRTATHVHFEVKGEEEEKPASFLSLGGPSTDSKIVSLHGPVPANSHGYTVITAGGAWTEAKEENYILSSTENVHLRAPAANMTVTLQAEAGSVQSYGGTAVKLMSPKSVSIASDPSITSPPEMGEKGPEETFFTKWRKEWWEDSTSHILSKTGSTMMTIGEVVTSLKGVRAAWAKVKKVAKKNAPGSTPVPRKSILKDAADLILFGSTVTRGVAEFTGGTDQLAGSLSLYGQKFTAITGGVSASMYGGVAASLTSLGQAEVLGGASAVLKSLMWTEVTSTQLTGVTSNKDIEIDAMAGKVEMKGKTEINISSEDELLLHGEETVQMSSEKGSTAVFGEKFVYVASAGYGMKATSKELDLGKMSSPTDFGAAKGDTSSLLHIDSGSVKLTQGDGAIVISQGGNTISIRNKDQKSTLGMLGGVVKISAKCILLDG